MTQQVIKAQAQNTLPRLLFVVGFFVGAGLFGWLTYDALSGNTLLWLGGMIGVGLLLGWAAGTWLLVKLA